MARLRNFDLNNQVGHGNNLLWHDNAGSQSTIMFLNDTDGNQYRANAAEVSNCIGSQEAFCIKKTNHEVVVKFIRGFADPDRNTILIS